jgi:hypothetical protein
MISLDKQITDLQAVYCGLQVEKSEETIRIHGPLAFKAQYGDLEQIEDAFEIAIFVPKDYPKHLPTVRETTNRIKPGFGHLHPGGTLCLAVPMEERRLFLKEPNLLGFVKNLVIPYFYSYVYWELHGVFPYGEAAHGKDGIQQYYENIFNSQNTNALKLGLFNIYKKGYRGHLPCPCGSGKAIRCCHKEEVLDLTQPEKRDVLAQDILRMFRI